MSSATVKISLLSIQIIASALSISVIVLNIKAFEELQDDEKLVEALLPGGKLHAKPMIGVGIALIIICALNILFAMLNAICLMEEKLPHPARRFLTDRFGVKSMTIAAFILTPISIAQTCLTATRSARVTSTVLPESLVETLVRTTGRSLRYKDFPNVLNYTIITWFIWLLLLIGIAVELSKSLVYTDDKEAKNNFKDQEPKTSDP